MKLGIKLIIVTLAVVILIGAGAGGAFASGIAVGKGQGEKAARQALQNRFQGLGQGAGGQSGQRPSGQQGGAGAFGQRRGVAGVVEGISGNTITLNTPQGPVQALLSSDTQIQRVMAGTIGDLKTGVRVTLVGQRNDDGSVDARSVTIIPGGLLDPLS